jgi:hypothetical protein
MYEMDGGKGIRLCRGESSRYQDARVRVRGCRDGLVGC